MRKIIYRKVSMWDKKMCGKCGIEKYCIIDFPANTRRKSGVADWCRDCCKLYFSANNKHN
jgi:hypothetical protein